jgi:hypothetical protein
MPRGGTRRTPPPPGGKGIGTSMRLIAREPHLADAARLETGLADLYRSIAALQPEGTRGPVWRQAAHLTGEIADALAELASAAGAPRHNPRPTRIRVATLREADIQQAAHRVESLRHSMATNGSGGNGPCTATGPTSEALAELAALEGRSVLVPLVRLFGLAPSSRLYNVWRIAAVRRRLLCGLGVGSDNGWPDPPARPNGHGRARSGAAGPAALNGKREWTALGTIERVNPARRCGTARTEDGRTAFFAARAVPPGLPALARGDPVRLRLRKGPLGLTAVRVEAAEPEAPAP